MQILEAFKVLFVGDPTSNTHTRCLGGVHPQKSHVPILKDYQVLVLGYTYLTSCSGQAKRFC